MFKLSQILVAIGVAVFFTVTVVNNLSDYSKTFLFVYHTLCMDTTAKNPSFLWRAINNLYLEHAIFIGIIVMQAIIAILSWVGVVKLFQSVKQVAIFACSLGFALYSIGFMTIAGQWFMMRESTLWNVQASVHVFLTFLGVSLIFLCMEERR